MTTGVSEGSVLTTGCSYSSNLNLSGWLGIGYTLLMTLHACCSSSYPSTFALLIKLMGPLIWGFAVTSRNLVFFNYSLIISTTVSAAGDHFDSADVFVFIVLIKDLVDDFVILSSFFLAHKCCKSIKSGLILVVVWRHLLPVSPVQNKTRDLHNNRQVYPAFLPPTTRLSPTSGSCIPITNT